jgi:hypothetical protein
LINDLVHMCLLLASHAPVNRIIAGRLPAPVTALPGIRLPIRVSDGLKLRVGMQALVYQGDRVVARARVDDLASSEVSDHGAARRGQPPRTGGRDAGAVRRRRQSGGDERARLASVKIR